MQRENEHLLTTRELAERLRVCPATLRRWAKAGRIPSVPIGPRIVRFRLEAVIDALERARAAGEGRAHE